MSTKKPDNEAEVKAVKAEKPDDEMVSIMVPYIEGQDPEVTVIINGHITKIKKGRLVKVSRPVAKVLENSNLQMMTAQANRKRMKTQVTDL